LPNTIAKKGRRSALYFFTALNGSLLMRRFKDGLLLRYFQDGVLTLALGDMPGGEKTHLQRMVHIIVAVEAAAAYGQEVWDGPEEIQRLIKVRAIIQIVDGIRILVERGGVGDDVGGDVQADSGEVGHTGREDLVVAKAPLLVARVAGDFQFQRRLSGRAKGSRPITQVLHPEEKERRLRDVNPGIIGNAGPVDDDVHKT